MANVVVGPWGSKQSGPVQGSFEGLSRDWLRLRAAGFRPGWRTEAARLLKREIWPVLGARSAELVTRQEVAQLLEGLPRGIRHNAQAVLSAVYRWGLDSGRVDVNPIGTMRRHKVRQRDRVLGLGGLREIWAATGGGHDFDRIVRLLLLTGQRRDEWGGARWLELRQEAGQAGGVLELPGERTKNGRPHRVPLAPLAWGLLPVRKAGRHWVFGRRLQPRAGQPHYGGFSGWSRCKVRLDRRLGFSDWTLHDLRRSFVTNVLELKLAQPHIVEAFVNHVSGHKGGVAGIYNRATYWEERCELAEKWAALFQESGPEGG